MPDQTGQDLRAIAWGPCHTNPGSERGFLLGHGYGCDGVVRPDQRDRLVNHLWPNHSQGGGSFTKRRPLCKLPLDSNLMFVGQFKQVQKETAPGSPYCPDCPGVLLHWTGSVRGWPLRLKDWGHRRRNRTRVNLPPWLWSWKWKPWPRSNLRDLLAILAGCRGAVGSDSPPQWDGVWSGLGDINPYAGGGLFGQYKIMQKPWRKCLKPWHIGTHLRVLSESYPMNTNLTGHR